VKVRVAIVAECFLPEVNGVTNTVLRICEGLTALAHQVLVVAPGAGPEQVGEARVVRMRSVPLPVYRSLQIGLPTDHVRGVLAEFRPDVVHLAAPAVLGWAGVRAAVALGVPSVAVFQTDLVGFARRYHGRALAPSMWSWLRRIHNQASLTLAPSTAAAWNLGAHGIERVGIWSRGVDVSRFSPTHREAAVRRTLAPGGEVIVGYIGRLAREKQVDLLEALDHLPGTRTVVVGDGPMRKRLQRQLPNARFLGFLGGIELSQAYAALDIFVHTGAVETFCQAVQEALASGVPVVAPAAGGPLDLVRHGLTGFLFPPGDAGQLAQAVGALAADEALRRRMGAGALASVMHRTWPSLVDELIGWYQRVLVADDAAVEPAA